jgi:hypothetical protein
MLTNRRLAGSFYCLRFPMRGCHGFGTPGVDTIESFQIPGVPNPWHPRLNIVRLVSIGFHPES